MWKNRLWYLLLLLTTAYLSIFYQSYALTVLLLIEAAFPFVTLFMALAAGKRFSAALNVEKSAIVKNEDFGVELVFRNNSFFPIARIHLYVTYWNQFSNDVKKEPCIVSIENHSTLKVVCGFRAEYCGNIEFGITGMVLYDMIGIWKFSKPFLQTCNVSVLPNIEEIEDRMLRGGAEVFLEEEVYSARKSGDDPSEIFQIREYEQSDKLNRIHWKLSVKEGKLMTKDFGLPLDSSVVIFIELAEAGQETECFVDAEIEAAASLSFQFILQKQIHFIAWYDIYVNDSIRRRVEKEDDLYEALAHLYTAAAYEESFRGLVDYQEKYRTEQYSNLFYISTDMQEEEIQNIREFAKSANCHVIWVTEADWTGDAAGCFEEAGLTCSLIHPASLREDISGMTVEVFT